MNVMFNAMLNFKKLNCCLCPAEIQGSGDGAEADRHVNRAADSQC